MEPAISSPLMSSPAATAPPLLVKRAPHVLVTTTILVFLFLLFWATYFCRSAEGFAINAIVLVYYMAMIHLDLLTNLDQVLIWPLMLAATGIAFISVATAVLVFQPDRRDSSDNAIFSFLCLALAIQLDRHNIGRHHAKSQDASDDLV